MRSLASQKFGVIHDSYDQPLESNGFNPPTFIRVRIVDVIEMSSSVSYMTCTCFNVQAMLLPCVHCIAVLGFLHEDVELANIHPRWFSVYGYNMQHHSESSNILLNLREVTKFFDSNMYCSSTGQFLGCPLSNKQIIAVKEKSTMSKKDKVYEDMIEILNYNLQHGPRGHVATVSDTTITPFPFATQEEFASQQIVSSSVIKKVYVKTLCFLS